MSMTLLTLASSGRNLLLQGARLGTGRYWHAAGVARLPQCNLTTQSGQLPGTEGQHGSNEQEKRHRVVVLAGPTAVGKTELSLQLAEEINGEIVSADSVQVYRGMDIGTDKVSKEDQARVKHHLIDVVDVYDTFSSGEFAKVAMQACKDVVSRGKTPIIVGGTWFYHNTFYLGSTDAPLAKPHLEKKILGRYKKDDEQSWQEAIEDLKAVDPESAATIAENDWYRLIRSLSVYEMTGEKFSSFMNKRQPGLVDYFDVKSFYMTAPRWLLYDRINQRCEQIIEDGLVEETIKLLADGLDEHYTAASAIGYRQAIEYLHMFWLPKSAKNIHTKRKFFMNFLKEYQAATRQLSSGQMRAFRKDPRFHWVLRDEGVPLEDSLDEILEALESDKKPVSLERWDRDVIRQNAQALRMHATPLSVYSDRGAVDNKIAIIEAFICSAAPLLGWNVDHLTPDEAIMEHLISTHPLFTSDAASLRQTLLSEKDATARRIDFVRGGRSRADAGESDEEGNVDAGRKLSRGERRRERFLQSLKHRPKKQRKKMLKKYNLTMSDIES